MSATHQAIRDIEMHRQQIDKEIAEGRMSPYPFLIIYEQFLKGNVSPSVQRLIAAVTDVQDFDIPLLMTPLYDLGLSVRATNCLDSRLVEATNLGRIIQLSLDDILNIKQLGPGTAGEIQKMVKAKGLWMGTALPPEILRKVGTPRS